MKTLILGLALLVIAAPLFADEETDRELDNLSGEITAVQELQKEPTTRKLDQLTLENGGTLRVPKDSQDEEPLPAPSAEELGEQ